MRFQLKLATAIGVALLGIVGCKSSNAEDAAAPTLSVAPTITAAPAKPVAVKPMRGQSMTGPFAQLRKGMAMSEVERLVGKPVESRGHLMGKNFIPFYFGKDRYRTTWFYAGKGRVIFNTGAKVMMVEEDTTEDGHNKETPAGQQ